MGPTPIADGWGAYWIDGLICHWCDKEWPLTGGGYDGPDQRQYISINVEPATKPNTLDPEHIHLCPECASELADIIWQLLDEDVPMGMKPEDTDTMCALPDDYYLWPKIDEVWWDDDTKRARDADGNEVRWPNGDSYKLAMKQRKPHRGTMRKDRR